MNIKEEHSFIFDDMGHLHDEVIISLIDDSLNDNDLSKSISSHIESCHRCFNNYSVLFTGYEESKVAEDVFEADSDWESFEAILKNLEIEDDLYIPDALGGEILIEGPQENYSSYPMSQDESNLEVASLRDYDMSEQSTGLWYNNNVITNYVIPVGAMSVIALMIIFKQPEYDLERVRLDVKFAVELQVSRGESDQEKISGELLWNTIEKSKEEKYGEHVKVNYQRDNLIVRFKKTNKDANRFIITANGKIKETNKAGKVSFTNFPIDELTTINISVEEYIEEKAISRFDVKYIVD